MTITFQNDIDIIVYALEKIISYTRRNQYIFLAQSIWWISSIIGLQQGLVDYINNLKRRSNITIQEAPQQDSYLIGDVWKNSEINTDMDNIHSDRINKVGNPEPEISEIVSSDWELSRLPQVKKETEQFLRISWKERKAFHKQKQADQVSKMGSGKVIAKPLSNKRKNFLQSIPTHTLANYLKE
jgi:hypothetical protein